MTDCVVTHYSANDGRGGYYVQVIAVRSGGRPVCVSLSYHPTWSAAVDAVKKLSAVA